MPPFFHKGEKIFVLCLKWGGTDTPANAENSLCRTKYGDEPCFRGFSIAPRLPRLHKLSICWRTVCRGFPIAPRLPRQHKLNNGWRTVCRGFSITPRLPRLHKVSICWRKAQTKPPK